MLARRSLRELPGTGASVGAGQCVHANAPGEVSAVNVGKDLVAIGALASDETGSTASGVRDVAKVVAVCSGRGVAKADPAGTCGDGAGVSLSVADGAVGGNVKLLATRNGGV